MSNERDYILVSEVNMLPDIADIIFCPAVMSSSTKSPADMAIVGDLVGMGSAGCILSCPWPL